MADEETAENRIIPDGGFVLENIESGRRGLFFVEMDMATERIVTSITRDTRVTLHHKISQYDRYLTSGRFARTYAPWGEFKFFTLLFVTFGEKTGRQRAPRDERSAGRAGAVFPVLDLRARQCGFSGRGLENPQRHRRHVPRPRAGTTTASNGQLERETTTMLLKLTRNQKKSMIGMGAPTFTLAMRVELTPEEAKHVKDYKMGKTVLYSKEVVEGTGIIGFVAKKAFNTSLTIDDMVNGKSIDLQGHRRDAGDRGADPPSLARVR